MSGHAVSLLFMTIATAALSGTALFTQSPRVQQVSLELLFAVSAAVSLVVAVRLSLSRLADAASEAMDDELVIEYGGRSGSSMSPDSPGHHRSLTVAAKTGRAAAAAEEALQPPVPATRDSV